MRATVLLPALALSTAMLAACTVPVPVPTSTSSAPDTRPRAGQTSTIEPCTILEVTEAEIAPEENGLTRIASTVGGMAGGLVGLGQSGSSAGGALSRGLGGSQTLGVEYTVETTDGRTLIVLQDIPQGEPALTAGSECRIRSTPSTGLSRILPPVA